MWATKYANNCIISVVDDFLVMLIRMLGNELFEPLLNWNEHVLNELLLLIGIYMPTTFCARPQGVHF